MALGSSPTPPEIRSPERDRPEGAAGAEGQEDEEEFGDAFDIPHKNASHDSLLRWRQAALVLNASRRFRYTLDLKKEEEKEIIRRTIRSHAQVIRAVFLFKEAGENDPREACTGIKLGTASRSFPIELEKLKTLNRNQDSVLLQEFRGVKGLSDLLKSNLDRGINPTEDELLQRRNAFGENTYPRKKRKNILRFVFDACKDLTLIILMVAAAISLTLGMATEGVKEGWYEGGSIFLAVFLVILVTATSDYRQSLQFQHLNEEKQNIQVEVLRGGKRFRASIFDLVVGDVVPLNIGDQVPGDGILISGHSLAIDESSMTGESKTVHKDQKAPFLMSGCKVADGYGSMLVTGVGINTEWGQLMANLSEDNGEETPLQVRLNGVATFIGMVGLSVAGVVLGVLAIRYFTGHTKNPDGTVQFRAGTTGLKQGFMGAIRILTIAVTIVVVAVPEGLPLAVTLTLAYSMRKMMRDKALVRRLSSCETMGSATTICSDKTGTLTLNKMTVVEAHFIGTRLDPCDDVRAISSSSAALLIEGIAQNTTGTVFLPEDGGAADVTGSPTEKAILSWGLKIGMDFSDVRSKSSALHVFPFNSEKKRGGVAVQSDTGVHIHWKGAAELVLSSCKSWLSLDGSVQPMGAQKRNEYKKSIEDMAKSSLRCVAFAYCQCDIEMIPKENIADWKLPDEDLTLLGIVGIKNMKYTSMHHNHLQMIHRFVLYEDYYGMSETNEPKGLRHVKADSRTYDGASSNTAEWEEKLDSFWQDRIQGQDPLEILKAKDKIDAAASEVLDPHVRKIRDEKYGWKYGCGAKGCTKLFHASEFVTKHLKLKHTDFVVELTSKVREDIYFENYMNDPKAPGGIPIMQQSAPREKGRQRPPIESRLRDERGRRFDRNADSTNPDGSGENPDDPVYDSYGDPAVHGAFPPDIPAPPMLMPVPGAGPLGPFIPAPPEVAMRMLREQGGPPPFEPGAGPRPRKAGRGGGPPMGGPSPILNAPLPMMHDPRMQDPRMQDPRKIRSYQDLDAPGDEVTVLDYRSL